MIVDFSYAADSGECRRHWMKILHGLRSECPKPMYEDEETKFFYRWLTQTWSIKVIFITGGDYAGFISALEIDENSESYTMLMLKYPK